MILLSVTLRPTFHTQSVYGCRRHFLTTFFAIHSIPPSVFWLLSVPCFGELHGGDLNTGYSSPSGK